MPKTKQSVLLGLLFAIVFFLVGLSTLSHYGINWDEPGHFIRGQAFVKFFLSGGKNADYQRPKSQNQRISIYDDPLYPASFWYKEKEGHPPVVDMFYSVSNLIFYEKLGIWGDVEAYNLAGILLSAVLIYLLIWFACQQFGVITAVFAGLSLCLYPMFLAESHFNIKDPPEAVFFSASLIFLYLTVIQRSRRYFILSIIFIFFALGTKLNILFLPFIFFPWLIFYLQKNKEKKNLKLWVDKFKIISILPLVFICGFILLVAFWPSLWQNLPERLRQVWEYYHAIGTLENLQPGFLYRGFNFYPAIWIIYTTPVIVLILSLIGLIESAYCLLKKKKDIYLLLILWFLIPIIRVSLPGTAIYGGSRQIMEFIPALALLSGIGTASLFQLFKSRSTRTVYILILGFFFTLLSYQLFKLHPNETMYFNELSGGLKGAYAQKIPAAGLDLGNIYRQGAVWLNKYAESKAKLTLVNRGVSALPGTFLRPDIKFSENLWSGQQKQGEYVMELTQYDWTVIFPTRALYLERFLQPIHVISIDGTAVLKIWKNSPEFLLAGYRQELFWELPVVNGRDEVIVNLPQVKKITKMKLFYDTHNCSALNIGIVSFLSTEDIWRSQFQPIVEENKSVFLEEGILNFEFPGELSKKVRIQVNPPGSCIATKSSKALIRYLTDY